MGYTHYTNGTPVLSPECIEAVKLAVEKTEARGITIHGWDGYGQPTISQTEIRLNGNAATGDDYETFALTNGQTGFSFCKTGRAPYNVLVAATLLIVDHFSGSDFYVESDGYWAEDEWVDARGLFAEVMGFEAIKPKAISE